MNAITTKAHYFFDRTVQNNALLAIFIVLLFIMAGVWLPVSGGGDAGLVTYDDPGLLVPVLLAFVITLTVVNISLFIAVIHHASSYISPKIALRMIRGLAYQAIGGFYLGTIIYLCLLSAKGPEEASPLSLTLGLCFALLVFVLFVYFVYSVSVKVYGRGVVYDIYNFTRKDLERAIEGKRYILEGMLPQTSQWEVLSSPVSGYLHTVNQQGLMKHGYKVQVLAAPGSYRVQGTPLLKVEGNGRLDEKAGRQLLDQCKITLKNTGSNGFMEGFGQLTEIAVKSLSATSNDRETAIHCIHCLTELFRLRMRFADHATVSDRNGEVKMYLPEMTLKELMYQSLAPIREYGRSDAKIMLTLLNAVSSLMGVSNNKRNHSILLYHAGAIIETAKKNIDGAADREKLNEVIEAINASANTDRYLHYLKSPVMAGT